jgi:small GTP-binding protein
MVQKKVCMLGAFAVGKTSLVTRSVHSIFSEKYLTTLGVKIDKKPLQLGEKMVELILWDIAGEDDFHQIRLSYLRGAAGCMLVVDGTRRASLETALQLHRRMVDTLGDIPCVLLLNKVDLSETWELQAQDEAELKAQGFPVIKTSAKTNVGVEEAFTTLAACILNGVA